VEGLGVSDEHELLLVDTPAAFAATVLRLLEDANGAGLLGKQLGGNANHFVKQHFSWEAIIPHLESVYQQLQQSNRS
jgi:glycosyltransferase involved in cell wall biosynthesis